MTIIILLMLMLDELLSKLVLLLLLIERFDNTLLLLFDRFGSGRSVMDQLSSRVLIVIIFLAGVTGSILVLHIVHSHPLALGNLLLFLLQPILMSLLAERLYHALLLLLHGRLSVHHLLMLDDHTYRVVRITDRIVLDNLLRVMVMSAVVETGYGNRMIGGGGYGFDHFQSSGRGGFGRLRLTVSLLVIVHLELRLLLLRMMVRRRRRGR